MVILAKFIPKSFIFMRDKFHSIFINNIIDLNTIYLLFEMSYYD